MIEHKSWKTAPMAGILPGGTSVYYKTGTWRTFRPVIDMEKCVNCLTCWVFCPDSAVKVKEGKIEGINYDYCKGCGICAEECPVKAIKMVSEQGGASE